MKGTILYGGSFNPPTIAHILCVRYMLNTWEPDNFLILPTKTPPHKPSDGIGDELRLDMIRHTFEVMQEVEVCPLEFHMEGPSYTYKTLAWMREKYEDVYFLMGMDSYNTFFQWVKPELILKYATMIVLRRGGVERQDHALYEQYKDRFIFLENPIFELSSTEVRTMCREKKDIRYFVLDRTYGFIKKHQLWREDV